MSRAISVLLAIEAAVCGGAVTVAFVFNFTWLAIVPILTVNQSPITAAKSLFLLLSCVCALAAFWHLVFSTVTNQKYPLNLIFLLGIVGSIFSLIEVTTWSESWVAYAIFYAPVMCALHFLYLQYMRAQLIMPNQSFKRDA
jgi:hypothetical protein